MFASLPRETKALRAFIRPMRSQAPNVTTDTPITFGEAADEWLSENDVDPYYYIRILQAWLYSINAGAFSYTMETELGWSVEDAVEFWSLINTPEI